MTFETPQFASLYVEETGLDWPMLIDESRSLYHAYGMDRGSILSIWGPQNWGSYLKIMAHGRMPRMPHDDVNQLGGDVIIDPNGIVRLQHVSQDPTDRPSIDALLATVRVHAT